MKNNFITNYKTLYKRLQKIIIKHKITNVIFQNEINIVINKLYCETNIFILKNVMYNLSITNYKIIYEEDYYKNINNKILCMWDNIGIYIDNNNENFVDYKTNINELIDDNTLVITTNKSIIEKINKKILLYENTKCPVFNMIKNKKILTK